MYDVQLIAKYIIHRHALPINDLKLQKILYFVQAEFLVAMNRACFDDDIEAWDHGPVVPAVYSQYMIFSSTNIPDQGHDGFEVISRQDKNHLDAIIDTAAKYSASWLEKVACRQKPWINACKRDNKVIKRTEIKEYFSS
jgi:uncharacterized phage-associated protein